MSHPYRCCTALGVALITSTSTAEVLPLFNPLQTDKAYSASCNYQSFSANDMLSIQSFLNDWSGSYHPKQGKNTAIGLSRFDMGITLQNHWYVGYFLTDETYSVANRGFVDFYHDIKRKKNPKRDNNYLLDLNLQGYSAHGITLSKSLTLLENPTHKIKLGIATYLSSATNAQDGYLKGIGRIHPDETYDATATANYRYMENLLYDYHPNQGYGIGYGAHLGISYENSVYGWGIHLIANDLLAHIAWRDLPYSFIELETKNQTIDKHGHFEYNPTIRGTESYADYQQTIKPKYHIDIAKSLSPSWSFSIGLEHSGELTIPYATLTKTLDKGEKLSLSYEERFHSIGIAIQKDSYHFSLSSNGLRNASAFAFSGGYRYRF